MPCSTKTNPDNTLCYPPDEIETSCPITEIFFVKSDTIDKYRDDSTTYISQKLTYKDEEWYFVYSKKSGDNLPIVATKLESGMPCINVEETSEHSDNTTGPYYPLERDRKRMSC